MARKRMDADGDYDGHKRMPKRPGGGYNSRRHGDGLGAAEAIERLSVDRNSAKTLDPGGSMPLKKPGRHKPMNGGKTSSSGHPIHKRFNFGNNSTGRGHQSHHSGERKKY